MKMGFLIVLAASCLCLATANAAGPRGDVYKGKLFPPNIILQYQAELELSKDQFTAIKSAVVEVQANIAEHEWDLREAYLNIMTELDKSPLDEDRIMQHVNTALLAENEVKKRQMAMLIRLRQLLTDDQVAFLKTVHGEQ